MRKKIVAGNWKMNLSLVEAKLLVDDLANNLPDLNVNNDVILCVPFTHISTVHQELLAKDIERIKLGAQNCNDKLHGAFTGEVSATMLKELGVSHVIIGHSERRAYYKESNEFLKSKVDTLIEQGMNVIFCCGEPLEVRNQNQQNDYVASQLNESLFHLSFTDLQKYVTIAYEPIWAIGTGVTASTQQAQDMHAHIRSLLAHKYGDATAQLISILYGGSCNAQNAAELFANEDVDGGLIGGAALKAETFLPIIQAMI